MHTFSLKHLFVAVFFVLVTFMALPSLASAGSGNFSDCLAGCKPGVNACTDCCKESFESQCPTSCYFTYIDCTRMCDGQEGTAAVVCYKQCQANVSVCLESYAHIVQELSCSGWVAPEQCPDCQTWSPASQRCVSAPKEVCD